MADTRKLTQAERDEIINSTVEEFADSWAEENYEKFQQEEKENSAGKDNQ